VLEDKLGEEIFGKPGILEGFGDRRSGVDKLGQLVWFNQFQVQEMFCQKPPLLFLTV